MKVKKSTINTWIIACFLVLMENCFYLIDADSFPMGYTDLWLILLVVYYTSRYIKYKKNDRKIDVEKKNSFIPVMWLLVVLVVVSAIQAYLGYNQPIWLGLRPQRRFICILLTYYCLRVQFKNKDINFENIESVIIKLGIIQSVLYCLQHAVFDSAVFLHVLYRYRYGSVRLYVDSVAIVFMILFSFNRYLRTNKIRNLIPVALGIYFELTVSKGRLECVAIFASIIITFLLWKKLSTRKLLGGVLVVFAIIVFANTAVFDSLITAIEAKLGGSQQIFNMDTMAIRNSAHAYYWSELLKSPMKFLLGCGYPNTDFPQAAVASGFSDGYIFADNGIFSFIYAYGVLGILFLFTMYVRLSRNAYMIFKEKEDLRYITFCIFLIAISYNIIFWWWKAEWTYIMAILFAVTEHEAADIKQAHIELYDISIQE